jgi:NAD(P)-dependent dehydrogenase (short-subunit alcohol dehydrogenase family)
MAISSAGSALNKGTDMNVTVFGATGQIGRLVVRELLADGHTVTAYVRNPGKLGLSDARLVTVTGELPDEERILQAVRGSDAVISALGPLLRRGSTGTPVTDGIRRSSPPCEPSTSDATSDWRRRQWPMSATAPP